MVFITLSLTNKHNPQYFLTNVPDLEFTLPLRFCSLFVLQKLENPAASQCPFCIHVAETGANMVPKICCLFWGLHEGLIQ